MQKYKKSMKEAVRYVQDRRELAFFPDVNFYIALRLYEKNLAKK